MLINELSRLSGASVRTLHYYDAEGLLVPRRGAENGYREYDSEQVARLREIMFFRELDFPIAQIKEILTSENYDRAEAMREHRELLIKKRERITRLISLLEKSIEGEDNMSFKEFDETEINEYKEEAKARWGETRAYAQSEEKRAKMSKKDRSAAMAEMDDLLRAFSGIRGGDERNEAARELVEKWRAHITQNYYDCTDEILAGLAEMYTADARFTKNMDKFGEGTADFISRAIKASLGK